MRLEDRACFSGGLAEVIGVAGIPYGYTLTIWATGALCMGRFGVPTPAQVLLFVAGGTIGYAGLALLVGRGRTIRSARPAPGLWENAFAAPATGATSLIDRVVSSPGTNFFLSPLIATALYLLGLSLLVRWIGSGAEAPGERGR